MVQVFCNIRKEDKMENTIIKAPCVNLNKLDSIFIEMTAHNCNLNCPHCYIDFGNKKVKDFIPLDKVKQALASLNRKKLKYIHLTGAEPMLHPDFNHILRHCLKYSSVVIHTNAYSINDKKARFLRKVEEENSLCNEIVFMLSLDSYIEKENDSKRGRGSFRKVVCAIQSLAKYEFNPIISIVNHNNLPEKELKTGFKELCNSIGFETTDLNFKIIPLLEKNKDLKLSESIDFDKIKTECSRSRTLTVNGVFFCPLLASDNRGMCGTDFKDYSTKCYLETSYCTQCVNFNQYLFSFEITDCNEILTK